MPSIMDSELANATHSKTTTGSMLKQSGAIGGVGLSLMARKSNDKNGTNASNGIADNAHRLICSRTSKTTIRLHSFSHACPV